MPDERRRCARTRRGRQALTVAMVVAGLGCRHPDSGQRAAGQSCGRDADCAAELACVDGRCAASVSEPSGTTSRRPLQPIERAECRQLIHTINEVSASYGSRSAETPVELLRMADAISKAARQVASLELKSPAVRDLRDAYAAMTAELARAARDAGTAGTDGDKRRSALATLETIGPREGRLLKKINEFCGAS